MRKRDGPRIAANDQGPEQGVNERPLPLPQAQTPRNTTSGRPTSSHFRSRRRQDPSWRTFRVRVCLAPDGDATALYVFLKAIARRHGLTVASVDEISDPK